MARSIPLPAGFPYTYAPTRSSASRRPKLTRLIDWLMRARQRETDRAIAHYVQSHGIDHLTDSVEREIEQRFLARMNIPF